MSEPISTTPPSPPPGWQELLALFLVKATVLVAGALSLLPAIKRRLSQWKYRKPKNDRRAPLSDDAIREQLEAMRGEIQAHWDAYKHEHDAQAKMLAEHIQEDSRMWAQLEAERLLTVKFRRSSRKSQRRIEALCSELAEGVAELRGAQGERRLHVEPSTPRPKRPQ